MKKLLSLIWLGTLTPVLNAAATPEKPPEVPKKYEFIRTLDLEGGAYAWGKGHSGGQFFRIETRYRDPDPNAFVGLIATFLRCNENFVLGKDEDVSSAPLLSNWGADMGIVRGRHVWALDLMGASLGSHIAFAPAFVGEHELVKRLKLFHRTTIDFFVGDTFLDSDQGLWWSPWENVGFTAGYRIFAAKHMSRSGPRLGLELHFDIPKMPFIFPSIG